MKKQVFKFFHFLTYFSVILAYKHQIQSNQIKSYNNKMKQTIIALWCIVFTFSAVFPFDTRLSSPIGSQPVSPPPPAKPTLIFKRFPSDLKQLWNLVTPRFSKMPTAVRPNTGTAQPGPTVVSPQVANNQFLSSSTVSGKPFISQTVSPNPFISQPTRSPNPFLTQSASTANRRLTNSQVRDYIWNWMIDPQGPTTGPQSILISEKVLSQNQTHICKYRVFQSQNPSSTILNVDQQTNVIYAGGLLQGQNIVHGNQIFKALPFGLNHRNPLWIESIGNGIGSVKADAPISAEVHKVVYDFITTNTDTQNAEVYISFSKSDYMLDVFNALNFNSKIADKLGLTAIPGQEANRVPKLFVNMLQVIGKFAPSKINPTGGPSDAVGTFLNDLTVNGQTCRDFEKYDWWGFFNRPAYVNQQHFGRTVFISVDATPDALALYDQASAYPPNMNQILNKIFLSPSLRMFSIGSSGSLSLSALKSGNWQSYFYPLPANSLTSLRPIRFAVLDFRDNAITVTNKFQYDTSSCMKKSPHKIEIRLVDIYYKAYVEFKLTGQGDFHGVGIQQFVDQSSGRIDITNYLSDGSNDYVRINSVVGHHNIFEQYYRDATLEIYIDDVYREGFYSGCKACHSNSNAIVCNVNRLAGTYSCSVD